MFGGLNRLVAVALVAGAVLLSPTAALACNGGGPSAVIVYSECVPNGGGNKPTNKPTTSTPVSTKTQHTLNKAGKDKKDLTRLLQNYGHSARMAQDPQVQTAATSPSALGSAFDLGSGPTLLLAFLAGTALALLGVTGFRGYRRWQHRS